jgi:Carboxylesterase family
MKHRYLLPLLFLLALSAQAQNCLPSRYLQAQFPVDTLKDVVFGNAPQLTTIYISENITNPYDLKMDIYLPTGDTLARRPCLMMAFGGAFLIGSKEDEDVRSVCDSFARKGFVAASINYRLGLNTAINSSAERAVWRGAQDWSAAIRFLKEKADDYGIDTNYMFIGGASAGSFGALHSQYASDANRPASTYSQGLPFPQPDLGCKDCSGNTFVHSSQVRGLINCWGAIGDTAWIDAQATTPMISFHGDVDAIVPYSYGFPFTALITLPEVYGSYLIDRRARHIGLPSTLHSYYGEGHNIWGTIVLNEFTPGPTQHWLPMLDSIRGFLWRFLEPPVQAIAGPGAVNVNDVVTYSVPATPGYRYCWAVDGGTILTPTPSGNTISVRWDLAGVRAVRVRAVSHLDAVGDESSYLILVLPLTGASDASADLGLQVQQTVDAIQIRALASGGGLLEYRLYDLQGRVVEQGGTQLQQGARIQIHTEGLSQGMHVLQLQNRRGQSVQKILLTR